MRSCHDQLWYAWIYVLGSPKIASQYTCQIELQNLSDPEESVTFKGKPHSLDKSGQQVILSSEALVMTNAMVQKMYLEMSDDQKSSNEKDALKFLLCIKYHVKKINQDS